ncbi:serine/threonine-protein kinase [Actinoplanes sp. NPDC051343]|uniref:serine/threonine-protein kinase n=1 Tax=Actinoplanes sp. NPDC051343 TaxID=3363906 RepID=UPI00378E5D0C
MKTLSGRYRLRYPVGRGGMAVVWRADDMILKRTVAVKVLHPHLPGNGWVRRRILAEAIAAGRLSHPHIARVYDYGEEQDPDGNPLPYLVLEFVDGASVAALLADGPMSWPRTAALCASVADALAAAHAHGLVHRDVKAGNILEGSAGVKVVDFGVATEVGDDLADTSGHVWGTPGCLPPESIRDRVATPAADVYALGLLIVHCLTGQRLHRPEGQPVAPDVLHQLAPDSPVPLRELVRRCLLPDPNERPSAANVAADLRTLTPPLGDTEPYRTRPTADWSAPRRHRFARPAGLVTAGLIVIAAAGLVEAFGPNDSAGAEQPNNAVVTPQPSCRPMPELGGAGSHPCGHNLHGQRSSASPGTTPSSEPHRDLTLRAAHESDRTNRPFHQPVHQSATPATPPPPQTSGVASATTHDGGISSDSPSPPSHEPSTEPTTPAPSTSTPGPAPSSSATTTAAPSTTSASPADPQSSAAIGKPTPKAGRPHEARRLR